MKKTLLFFFISFLIINLYIIFSGKSWLYKGVAITYLKGYSSSYIDDFIYFPSDTIKSGKHQEWLLAKDYNARSLPHFFNEKNKTLNTVAFMVIKNDSIKHEAYWDGYSADSMSNSFSMAKSWVSTLIGIAIKNGDIKTVNQKICDFLPEFCAEKKSEITIEHLLTMSSGLNWDENYYNPLGQTAEAYYGNDLKKLTLNLNSVETPGKVFKYHSSCTQILVFILENATGKTISEYASEKLWIPIGAKHPALWSKDMKGKDEKGFCCINSNLRDFARIGKLYMNYGSWNNNQLLDSSYIKDAISIANLFDKNGEKNKKYGYHFWITNYNDLHVYYARGFLGQYVICVPEKNMIIVRLGRNQGRLLPDGHWEDLYMFLDAATQMYP